MYRYICKGMHAHSMMNTYKIAMLATVALVAIVATMTMVSADGIKDLERYPVHVDGTYGKTPQESQMWIWNPNNDTITVSTNGTEPEITHYHHWDVYTQESGYNLHINGEPYILGHGLYDGIKFYNYLLEADITHDETLQAHEDKLTKLEKKLDKLEQRIANKQDKIDALEHKLDNYKDRLKKVSKSLNDALVSSPIDPENEVTQTLENN